MTACDRPLNVNLSHAFINNALHSYSLLLKSLDNSAQGPGTPNSGQSRAVSGAYVAVKNSVELPVVVSYPENSPTLVPVTSAGVGGAGVGVGSAGAAATTGSVVSSGGSSAAGPAAAAPSTDRLQRGRRGVVYKSAFPVGSAVGRPFASGVRTLLHRVNDNNRDVWPMSNLVKPLHALFLCLWHLDRPLALMCWRGPVGGVP